MLARALVTISEPRHEALILPLLGSDNGVVAANAARAIAENGSDTAAQAMIAALNHGNRNVRIFAARALGRAVDTQPQPWRTCNHVGRASRSTQGTRAYKNVWGREKHGKEIQLGARVSICRLERPPAPRAISPPLGWSSTDH